MSAKNSLLRARALIKHKRYDEARDLLKSIDHPLSKQWLNKLDANLSHHENPDDQFMPSNQLPGRKGEVKETFGLSISALLQGLIMFTLTFSICFIGFLAIRNDVFETDLEQYGYTGFVILMFFIGLALLMPSLFAFIEGRKTVIYTNGVERVTRFEKIYTAWNELEGVKGSVTFAKALSIPFYTFGGFDFYVNGKSRLRVSPIDSNYRFLNEHINDRLIDVQLPRLLARFKRGETIEFGKIHIDQNGIHNGRRHLALIDFADVEILEGFFIIKKLGGKNWLNKPLGSIYNPFLLSEFLYRACD